MNTSQKQQLHQAIIGYLQTEIGEKAAAPVAQALGVEAVPDDMKGRLEAKWKALIFLQSRITKLEQELQSCKRPKVKGEFPSDPQLVLDEHRDRVLCVALHPKWQNVASGCEDGTIKIWNTESGDRERTLKAHTRSVNGVDYGARILVSCSSDLYVRIFDIQNEYALISTLVGHEHTVSSVKLFANDEKIASCSRDHTIRIWDTSSGYCTQVIKGHSDWVRTISISPVLGIVSGGSDPTVRVTPLNPTGAAGNSYALMAHENVIECSAIAPETAHANLDKIAGFQNVAYFATGSRDKTIILWTPKQQVLTLRGHDNWVRGLFFHPDGRFLFSVSDDKTIRIWDLENGAQLFKTVAAHDHFVTCVAGNAKMLVTGSVDKTVRVW